MSNRNSKMDRARRNFARGVFTRRDMAFLLREHTRLSVALAETLMNPDKPAAKVARNARRTSRDAAEMVLPHTGTQRREVLDFITSCGREGATDDEIEDALGYSGSRSSRPRRVELVERGWVVPTKMRRKTESGADAIVWRLSPAARESLRRLRT